ncbi:biotin-dependent carboxyltransferase family protein [Paenarthrobacter sp. YJN-5]|uniref:5-oxoprolinase subunit C family protein n=1 Tax=Paenarthrobacter sp. YJN-5 TaxID=2735316 RepID=UPI001877BC00|nr:biotin-dependent carboxyltransferase family protein [Paenarthrobacter sp. YJN-5]QOT19856.1 biotin-dependent carboxyltransferase [Paenarthrobacter sp. YJN-5]
MALIIKDPGFHSTVQDLGRAGHYHVGVPLGGAMDTLSHEIANSLVGNDPGLASIECTFTGPKFITTEPSVMAVTGAAATVTVNGEERPQWESIDLKAGDEIAIGFATSGTRAYLAFRGGIDVPVVLGSRSTYSLGKIGGLEGRRLVSGDIVPVEPAILGSAPRVLRQEFRPLLSHTAVARVVLGPYDHLITAKSLDMLSAQEWELTPVADRTGFRFSGDEKFEFNPRQQPTGAGSDPSNIVDAGYPMGSIQIPGGGQPIVLHRDAVSAGGYAMIATVISSDLNTIAQLAPKSTTRFEVISIEEALAARAVYSSKRARILHSIAS